MSAGTDTPAPPVIDGTVLDLILETPAGEHQTIRHYLMSIFIRLWETNEDFSPVRPLGLPEWQLPVYEALARAGLISQFCDGGVNCFDWQNADQIIAEALQALR